MDFVIVFKIYDIQVKFYEIDHEIDKLLARLTSF